MQVLLLAFMEMFGFLLAERASSAAPRPPLWAKVLVAVLIVIAALVLALAAMAVVALLAGVGVGIAKSA